MSTTKLWETGGVQGVQQSCGKQAGYNEYTECNATAVCVEGPLEKQNVAGWTSHWLDGASCWYLPMGHHHTANTTPQTRHISHDRKHNTTNRTHQPCLQSVFPSTAHIQSASR